MSEPKNTMSDRVELSEALRSILDDSDSETEDQKENFVKTDFRDGSSKTASLGKGIKSSQISINRALSYITTGHSRRSALSPSADQSTDGTIRVKTRKVESEDDQSPPKKRRHANHVIILRQPRSKAKQQKCSPRPSTDKGVKSLPSEAQSQNIAINDVKSHHSNKEFTVELETGIAGPAENSLKDDVTHTVDQSGRTNILKNITENVNTPPRSGIVTQSSAQKYLEAAIDCQIKLEASEEEIESGIPVLDGLDPTASPFCHFTDTNQQQLYSELSALDDGNGMASSWPANQEEALHQLAASQQLLQCAGKFYFGEGGPPHLQQGEGPHGRWVSRGGSADDSLTNITWLKRMSAPDLDPSTLQSEQMMDPRFERPPYSYSTLIQFAISSSRSGKMTLREIYNWIEETFPFFKTAKAGWRNSIRHNLSLHKIFIREPPMTHGQPAFWTLRPGTVVRLPEHRMFVADPENGGTLLQECMVPPPSVLPSMISGPQQGAPFVMGAAMPQVVMVPGLSGGMANSNKSREHAGSGPKTKKPPLILPRGSQPYALVPVPLLLPPGQNGGQTTGDGPTSYPHILSPIIMGGVRHFAATSTPQMFGGRKVVPIAPKVSISDGGAHNPVTKGSSSSSTSSISVCDTSSGADSGIDLSGQNLTLSNASTTSHSSFSNQIMPNRDLPFKKRGQGRKSLPRIREDSDDTEGEDSFTAFFEQELASPPKRQDMPIVSTPCKTSNLQTWLSPLRGFTPFKNPPLDGDSGIFHDLHDDLSLSSLPTGLTPNYKSCQRGATKAKRLRIGSLGEFGLQGLTPEKGGQSSDGIHNQSFGQIFGDLVSLDIEGEGMDVGNLSWTMFSPNKQQTM